MDETNMDIDNLVEKVSGLMHEDMDSGSEHLQAFINGWNNAIKEVLSIIESK
jgi:hypothetical protein